MTQEQKLEELFTYHAPEGDQPARYQRVRTAARILVKEILESCPPCADRTAAIRKVREAQMTANASIALKGLNL